MKIEQEFIDDVMIYYSKGYNARDIAKILSVPYCRIRKIILDNGGKLTQGKLSVKSDSVSCRVVEDWQNGLTSIDLLAERYGKKKMSIYGILYRAGITVYNPEMYNTIKKIAEREQNGEKVKRGWQSALAKRYSITRQGVSFLYRKIKNQAQ